MVYLCNKRCKIHNTNMESFIPEDLAGTPPTETVADRIRYLMYISHLSQAKFARRLGMDPANLSRALGSGRPVSETIINRIVADMGVSKKWLRDGEDVPFAKEAMAREILIDEPLAPTARVITEGTPVYDIDVTAGRIPLPEMFTSANLSGYVALPGIPRDTKIVHVSGDSMAPTICNGGYVAIREISDMRNIFWGQIYVVQTTDYRMVKFVRRHPDSSMVILHSDNPAYDDMEINRSDIISLYLVESIINFQIRC